MPFKNVELIKWVALILMIGDHINKYLLNDTIPILYNAGNVDHVFIKAFQAAVASSLCTDVATVSKDTQPEKELEPLIKMCAEKGEQSRAILNAYTNAAHT